MEKILLIDDDDDEFYFLKEALSDLQGPYDAIHARSVEEGVELMTIARPKIVFLDLNMPGTNGLDGLKLLKREKPANNIPVILYSTAISPENIAKGLRLGAWECLQKKRTISDLAESLTEILNRY